MDCPQKVRVLFVCTGNICRSPMAEAVFRQQVKDEGLEDCFEIASAATSTWELGEPPHPGTREVLRRHSIPLNPAKRARQITREDYHGYDYIIVMDDENVADMRRYGPVIKLLDYAPHTGVNDVPDPYYTRNFDYVYELVSAGSRGLLDSIRREKGL